MISVEEASQIVDSVLPKWGAGEIAEALYSDRPYPPFDRVMMDGVAVSFNAFVSGRRNFYLKGVCPAGAPRGKLASNEDCLEVMTGAPVPEGCDLVIPFEHLSLATEVASITLDVTRSQWENVHLKGSDCSESELILKAGHVFNGPHAGIAASLGYVEPALKSSPRVLLVSTGDELVEVTENPLPHQIRRSNVHALKRSLELFGFNQVELSHLSDDPLKVAAHYEKTASSYDLLIYSGGVSKGKFDYLPNVWTELGVERHFHEVSQRPGKPLWFGSDKVRKTIVVGLPGNPVSSLICLHRYLLKSRPIFARLSEEIVFKKELTYFLPVNLGFETDGSLWAHPLKIKNSGEFTALAGSDGFIELPREKSHFGVGEAFAFYSWSKFP